MAVQFAAGVGVEVAKAIGKRFLATAAGKIVSPQEDDGPSILKIVGTVLGGFALLLVFGVWVIISAPLQAWQMFTDFQSGNYYAEAASENSIGGYDALPSDNAVKWYRSEQKSLEAYAKENWNSGTGEDVYNLPDWSYLWSYDAAVSENDFELVRANADYYSDLHRSLLRAQSVTRSRSVPAAVSEDGKPLEADAFQGDDGTWYVNEYYNTWTVKCVSLKAAFSKKSFTATSELLYFAQHESGDYGGGWGDGGNALGYYQFDRRYGLRGFLDYVISAYPGKFDMLRPWAGVDIVQGDPGLADAWQEAYSAHPDEFAKAQDDYEWQCYGVPAVELAESYGLTDVSERRDCIKGLCMSICNLMGQGGASRYFAAANLNTSMSDADVARALCNAIIDNPPQPYPAAYANRYRAELEEVLWWLSQPAADASGSSQVMVVGSNPDAEGHVLSIDIKGDIAQNYKRATSAISVREGAFGYVEVFIDKDKYIQAVIGQSGVADEATSAEAQAIIDACMSTPSPDAGLCATWVSWVYQAAGYIVTPWGNANDMWRNHCTSNNRADLKPGMIIATEHSPFGADGWAYGHVGIYIGDGKVMHSIGHIQTDDIDTWIATYVYQSEARWGYPG